MAPDQRHHELVPDELTGIHQVMLHRAQGECTLFDPIDFVGTQTARINENCMYIETLCTQIQYAVTGVKAARKCQHDRGLFRFFCIGSVFAWRCCCSFNL